MKNNYFLLLILSMALVPFTSSGQNLVTNGDLELWDDPLTPAGWDLFENITRESVYVHEGDYAAGQLSTTSSQKFRQDVQGISGGQQYTISYYFLDNVDNAKTRIWSYWLDATGSTIGDDQEILRPDIYSENNEEWQHFNEVLTAPATATQFRFEVRVYHQDNNVDGHVYYDDFWIEGATTNYPEPTNYPTAFEATANGFTIALDWTDATGDQLPGAYLIYGQKGSSGNFPTPVDGTPVDDDLDWSDDKATVNVAFATETYTFEGLEGGEPYEFMIYPYTNIGENINYKTDGDAPEASANVSNIVVINEEDFEDGTLGTWWQYSVEGPQLWEHYEYQGTNFARMSGHDGVPVLNEDWLISPVMDFNPYQDVKFKFISAMNYEGPDVQLFFSQDYDGSSDPNGFTWLELTQFANWSQGDWTWTESGELDLSLYVYPTCYLAFKYTSTTEGAAAWEIDNLLVYSDGGVGIFERTIEDIGLYPNPAGDKVSMQFEKDGSLSIVNLSGQKVYATRVSAGTITIQLEFLPEGLYMIHFIGIDASVQTGKLLVR